MATGAGARVDMVGERDRIGRVELALDRDDADGVVGPNGSEASGVAIERMRHSRTRGLICTDDRHSDSISERVFVLWITPEWVGPYSAGSSRASHVFDVFPGGC